MKKILALLFLILMAGTAVAQEQMTDRLRKAIVEEEAGQNLDKAIDEYNDILSQYEKHRNTAATALFHMAGCYRKQDKKELAVDAYRRLLIEFPEQTKLADASRNYLASTYSIHAQQNSETENRAEGMAKLLQAMTPSESMINIEIESVEKKIEMIRRKIKLTESQIPRTEKNMMAGLATSMDLYNLKKELLSLQEQLSDMQFRLKVVKTQK